MKVDNPCQEKGPSLAVGQEFSVSGDVGPRPLTVPYEICDATGPRHLVWYYHHHGIYLPNTDQQLRGHIAEGTEAKKGKKLRVVPTDVM